MEIDLKVLAEKAEINWEDNWNFRSYLQHKVDPLIIDETVHSLYRSVSAAIDCTKCANCCRELEPHLEDEDVAGVATALSLSVTQTKNKYLQQGPEQSYRFSAKPCPLLNNKKCSIYNSRPADCREFPHLDKPDFLGGSVGAIENSRVCPIVYNVYEQLKTKFQYDPAIDYIGDSDPEAFNGSYWTGSS